MSEEKDFFTLSEAAKAVGLKRASLYYYIEKLNLKTHSFPLNRHKYLAKGDVERIKTVKESPWKLTQEDASGDAA